MNCLQTSRLLGFALAFLAFLAVSRPASGQGIALNGVGPINRSMGGASTAAPIDAAGAIHWNPASISGLSSSEMEIGLELLLPSERVSSRIEPGALGGGFPPVELSGSDRGEPGVSTIPTAAWVHKCKSSPWSYGLGMFGIGGFRVNYPGSATNPILTPQPGAGGLGMGRIMAEAEFLQIAPTISYALTEKFSIGVAPTITLGKVLLDPLAIAAPAGGVYTSGDGTRYHFGGGAQLGVYYITDSRWHLGASIKSPQWFEKFRYQTDDGAGGGREVTLDLDYPMIVSLGAAYSGFDRFIFACDVRYFDYKNTDGFGDPTGFDATGKMTGLGWSNLFTVSTGVQYRVTDRMCWRTGYTFQQNPFSDSETFFNVASPLNIQHIVAVGGSYEITHNVLASVAYIHGFENESSGPFNMPGVGPLAGTEVTSQISADALNFGITVQY